ncbi:hypothetical protein Ahy_A01g002582 [Arachis hypogaea]|uniref:Homeobox-leucine zipper protein n=1 Tax=Arachis hypogaea TaxID=3818 RepID=A0A445ER69_ARAHY|nr:hypothetical protein Ahy_A01g002582 [Arachis hypogaea]
MASSLKGGVITCNFFLQRTKDIKSHTTLKLKSSSILNPLDYMMDGDDEYIQASKGKNVETLPQNKNAKKKKSKIENKRRFSDEQIRSLECIFESESKLEPKKKIQLARDIGLQPRQDIVGRDGDRSRGRGRGRKGSLKFTSCLLRVCQDHALNKPINLPTLPHMVCRVIQAI